MTPKHPKKLSKTELKSFGFALKVGVIFVLFGFIGSYVSNITWWYQLKHENTLWLSISVAIILFGFLVWWVNKMANQYIAGKYNKPKPDILKRLLKDFKIPQSFINGSTVLGVGIGLAGLANLIESSNPLKTWMFIGAAAYGVFAILIFAFSSKENDYEGEGYSAGSHLLTSIFPAGKRRISTITFLPWDCLSLLLGRCAVAFWNGLSGRSNLIGRFLSS